MDTADPAIDGMPLEPIHIAGQYAATQRAGHKLSLFFFNEGAIAGAKIFHQLFKDALAQEVCFFARLRARKELLKATRSLCGGIKRLPL